MGYNKNTSIIDKENGEELLLFNTDSGKMVQLNITARLLWQKTNGSFDLEDLRDIIQDNCTSIGNIEKDLSEFIELALKNELVTKDGKD